MGKGGAGYPTSLAGAIPEKRRLHGPAQRYFQRLTLSFLLPTMASELLAPLHIQYITALAAHTSSLTYHLTTHLRLNAIYWAVTTLFLLGKPDALPIDDVVAYVFDCWDDEQGAFGSHPGHDAHVHVTLSAIQVLFMYGKLDQLGDKRERIITCSSVEGCPLALPDR